MANDYQNAMQGAASEYQNAEQDAQLTAQEQQEAAYRNNWLAKRDSVNNASNQNMANYLGASSAYASKGMGGGSAGGLQAQMNAQNQQSAAQASQDMSTANNDAMIAANQYETDLKNQARTDYEADVQLFKQAEGQRAASQSYMNRLKSFERGDFDTFVSDLDKSLLSGEINHTDAQNISNMLEQQGWSTGGNILTNTSRNIIGQDASDGAVIGASAGLGTAVAGGAVMGAVIGSSVPILGTAIGGILGGAVGGLSILFGFSGISSFTGNASTDLASKVNVQSFSDLVGLNTPETPEDYLPEESTPVVPEDVVDPEVPTEPVNTPDQQPVDLSGLQRNRNTNSMQALLNQGGY